MYVYNKYDLCQSTHIFRKSASQQRKSVLFKKYVNNIEQTDAKKKQVPDIHLNHRNMSLKTDAYCLKLRVCMHFIAATVNDINR